MIGRKHGFRKKRYRYRTGTDYDYENENNRTQGFNMLNPCAGNLDLTLILQDTGGGVGVIEFVLFAGNQVFE
jgi:hypothetical protein